MSGPNQVIHKALPRWQWGLIRRAMEFLDKHTVEPGEREERETHSRMRRNVIDCLDRQEKDLVRVRRMRDEQKKNLESLLSTILEAHTEGGFFEPDEDDLADIAEHLEKLQSATHIYLRRKDDA